MLCEVMKLDKFLPGDYVRFKPETRWAQEVMRCVGKEIRAYIVGRSLEYENEVYSCTIEDEVVISYSLRKHIFSGLDDSGDLDVSATFLELIERDTGTFQIPIDDLFEVGGMYD